MNDAQKRAIKSLERAFKKCADADLCFMGDGEALLCFDSDEFGEIERTLEYENKIFGCGNIAAESDDYEQIKTHNTFIDSGGA